MKKQLTNLMIRMFGHLGIGENFLKLIKRIYEKSRINIPFIVR